MKKSSITLASVSALMGAVAISLPAHAHQTYNVGTLNEAGNGWVYSVGPNYGNGVDGAINDSQGTGSPIDNAKLVWRSGVGAVSPEYTGNLPEMWYSGLHNTATGLTRREFGTVSTPGGVPGVAGPTGTTFFTSGNSLGARIATWNSGNDPDLPADSQIAVKGNSWLTGDGLDYGVSHVTCSGTAEACLADGDLKINWTLHNLNSLSKSVLGIAVYGGFDSSLSSDRTALFNGAVDLVDPQGSNLGAPIWSAVMSDPADVLSYTRVFDAAEAARYDGHYTVIIGALNDPREGVANGQYYLANTMQKLPAPGTLWLLAIGLPGLVAFSRRREVLSA